MMLAPGFSSDRIPVRVRLTLAIAVTLALAPPLMRGVGQSLENIDPLRLLGVIAGELMVGAALGLLARLYFLALETLATSVAMVIGLGNIFGGAIIEPDPTPALSTLIVLSATTLIFVTDQHLEMIRGLYLSYETAPILSAPRVEFLLVEIARTLTEAHLLALRICSPFLLFGLIINIALGLLSRLTPQVQIYFISGPLVIILGIYGFSLLLPDFLAAFLSQFGAWLQKG
jgi:flagellar biosynthetic protein FliR